jgi:putative ABC transport system permease protein
MRAAWINAAMMMRAKPGRTLAAGLGILLGNAVFLVTIGITDTISAQVTDQFDVYAATTVMGDREGTGATLQALVADQRVAKERSVEGVVRAARFGELDRVPVSYQDDIGDWHPDRSEPTVRLVDGDFIQTAGIEVKGFGFNPADVDGSRRVAIVGESLARSWGVSGNGNSIVVDGQVLTVVGLATEAKRLRDAPTSIMIPEALGATLPAPTKAGVLVEVRPGAAGVVAETMPLVLAPDNPGALTVRHAPDAKEMKAKVSDSMRILALGAGAIVLVGGMVAIANLLLMNVSARIRELGMRRAVGASRAQIVGQILVEAGLIGLVAGVAGAVLGSWIVYGAAIWQGWQPVLDLKLGIVGGVLGMLSGLVGGLLPAIVAARAEPAQALRL